MAERWLSYMLGPTDPQGPEAVWLPRSQDHLAQKHRNKSFEFVWPYTVGLCLWKNWCLRTMVLEKTLESLLDCKEIRSVHPKRNQPWIFIGRTDAEAETSMLWPSDSKNSLEKTLMLGKIEGRRRRGGQRTRLLGGITDLMDWVWASSRSWLWTGKPGVLQSMQLQKVRHAWETELSWLNTAIT